MDSVVTALLVALISLGLARPMSAEPSSPAAVCQEAAPGHPEGAEHSEDTGVESELVGSTVFQSGLLSIPPLVLDSHWFGLDGIHAGLFGLAWEFRRGGLRILDWPGAYWIGGRPAPAAMVCWALDSGAWVSQGALSLALRTQSVESAEKTHDSERVEEVRVAWRFGHRLKALSQIVAPDPELRFGFTWEPR